MLSESSNFISFFLWIQMAVYNSFFTITPVFFMEVLQKLPSSTCVKITLICVLKSPFLVLHPHVLQNHISLYHLAYLVWLLNVSKIEIHPIIHCVLWSPFSRQQLWLSCIWLNNKKCQHQKNEFQWFERKFLK